MFIKRIHWPNGLQIKQIKQNTERDIDKYFYPQKQKYVFLNTFLVWKNMGKSTKLPPKGLLA